MMMDKIILNGRQNALNIKRGTSDGYFRSGEEYRFVTRGLAHVRIRRRPSEDSDFC